MLTAAGVGSGLDIESVITQLMALERRPLEPPRGGQERRASSTSAPTASCATPSRGSSPRPGRWLIPTRWAASARRAATRTCSTLSATADADTQSHDVIVGQLATAHRLASNAYADADTAIGTGTLEITIGSDTLSLTLDGSNNTLNLLRDAINASEDNPGVTPA